MRLDRNGTDVVAPFAGAWIEIRKTGQKTIPRRSLPSRERGLKCSPQVSFRVTVLVAPFAGAWIEIENPKNVEVKARSLPSRERGLKLHGRMRILAHLQSLPSRERGLKSECSGYGVLKEEVAPFAGAWIEILHHVARRSLAQVAPFAGAWIEILLLLCKLYAKKVAPFAGAWIEISYSQILQRCL